MYQILCRLLLLELLPLLLFEQYTSFRFSSLIHLTLALAYLLCLFISPIDHTHIHRHKIYSVRSTDIVAGISVNNKATLIQTQTNTICTRLQLHTTHTHAYNTPEQFVFFFVCFGFICHSQLIACVYLFIHENMSTRHTYMCTMCVVAVNETQTLTHMFYSTV